MYTVHVNIDQEGGQKWLDIGQGLFLPAYGSARMQYSAHKRVIVHLRTCASNNTVTTCNKEKVIQDDLSIEKLNYVKFCGSFFSSCRLSIEHP